MTTFLFEAELNRWIVDKLDSMDTKIDELKTRLGGIMASVTDINALVAQLNTTTNGLAATNAQVAAGITEVGNDLQALRDQLAAGGTPEQVADAVAKLTELQQRLAQNAQVAQSNADVLTTLGQDPANPIP